MENEFSIFIEDKDKGNIFNITKQSIIYLDKKDVLKLGRLNMGQLDTYLHRHKHIKTKKHEKKRLISIQILDYIFKCSSKNK